MLFLLPRKLEGVESPSGGSALFSEQEIGSKIFSTCDRKHNICDALDFMKIFKNGQICTGICITYLLSHLFGRSAAQLLSRCTVALHHAAAAAGVSQQVRVDGVC